MAAHFRSDDGTFDIVGWMIEFEGGVLTEDEVIDGFQFLVDTGMARQLQGSYGRMAEALIEAGYVTPAESEVAR